MLLQLIKRFALFPQWDGRIVLATLLSLGGLSAIHPAATAADRLTLYYSSLQFSLSIDALETYAETGEITSEFAPYARWLDESELTQLRQVLQQRIDEKSALVAHFTYMDMGEAFLQRLGHLIQTESGLNGFYALRSALILAAADQTNGLTLLNVFEHFPGQEIRIDASTLRHLFKEIQFLSQAQSTIVEAVAQQSDREADDSHLSQVFRLSQLPDIRQSGSFNVSKQQISIDVAAPRLTAIGPVNSYALEVDVYLPEHPAQSVSLGPAPLVIVSHPLAAHPSDFAYLGNHLASQGIAVAIPDHPGSDRAYMQAFLRREVPNMLDAAEYVHRTEDMTRLLNELETLTATETAWSQAIDLQRVGVMGYSLGGTTALALAGAPINQTRLAQTCATNADITLNLSILLQCVARSLPSASSNLADSRIKAVMAIYPPASAIFGTESISQITLPTMMVAASQDRLAPMITEQLQPFLALPTPDKYLALLHPANHFTANALGTENRLPEFLKSDSPRPDPTTARHYLQALSTAFFWVYLGGRSDYLPYLSATYAQTISQGEPHLYLTQHLTGPFPD